MTAEKQRIAIAEACGWKWSRTGDHFAWFHNRKRVGCLFHESLSIPFHLLPDYLNDLNAMAEAVHTLPSGLLELNSVNLCRIATGKLPSRCNREDWDKFHNTTAAQRAEAFLKVIGKWEDE